MKALLLAGVATLALPGAALAQSGTPTGAGPTAQGQTGAPPSAAPAAPLPGDAQTAPETNRTAPAPATAQGQPAASSSDIVVTALRREQALQDVPAAITAFSSDQRDKLGIRSIQDFANNTPGLSFSSTLDRLSLRGVGRLTNTIGSDPGVAVYNDGFYTSSNAEASKTPMFVDRVEILRGPQGTLYGRNSVGGAINVISKRPTDTFGGEFRLTYDEFGGLIAEGFLSGPITDKLKYRVSVQEGPRRFKDPFQNIGGGLGQGSFNRFLVEGQLQYDFSDRVQLWLKYSHAEWDHEHYGTSNLVTPYATGRPNAAGQFFTNAGPTDPAAFYPAGTLVPNPGYGYTVPNPGVSDPRTVDLNTTGDDSLTQNHAIVANFSADTGPVTLKYVGGFSTYKYTLYNDLDMTGAGKTTGIASLAIAGGPFPVSFTYNPTYIQRYVEDKQNFSNEVTLSNSHKGTGFNYIVGAYQYHEQFFQPVTWYEGGDGSDNMAAALSTPVCVDQSYAPAASCPANPMRAFYMGTGLLKTDSYAGFGQVDYEVVKSLTLTAGLRYSSDHKTGEETYRLVNYNPTGSNYCTFPGSGTFYVAGCGPYADGVDITRYVLQIPGTGPAARTLSDTWSGFSWRLGADWKLKPDTLLFASYNRGLKSGGFNLGSFAASPEVNKETVDAYEVGLKSKPVKAVTFNLTGFYYDYKNAQIPIVVPLGTTALTTTNFFNIPKTRSLGAEVEAAWNVTRDFELSGTYSYLDATIRRAPQLFDDPNQPGFLPVNIDGNRVPATSRHKVSVNGLYDVPIGDDNGRLFLAASYYYRSEAYYDVFQSSEGRTPGWAQVDARVTYVDPSQRYTLILYARNLLDTLGYDYATGYSGTGAQGFGKSYSYTLPRQVGFEIHVKL